MDRLFPDMYQKFEIGETCHIFTANHNGSTTEGKVVKEVDIGGHNQYVIEVDVGIDYMYYVRDGFVLGMKKQAIVAEPDEPEEIENGYYWVKTSADSKRQIMERTDFGWFKIGQWKAVDDVTIQERIYNFKND